MSETAAPEVTASLPDEPTPNFYPWFTAPPVGLSAFAAPDPGWFFRRLNFDDQTDLTLANVQAVPFYLNNQPTIPFAGYADGRAIVAQLNETNTVLPFGMRVTLDLGEDARVRQLDWQTPIFYFQYPGNHFGDVLATYAVLLDAASNERYRTSTCFHRIDGSPIGIQCDAFRQEIYNLDVPEVRFVVIFVQIEGGARSPGRGAFKQLILDNITVVTDAAIVCPTGEVSPLSTFPDDCPAPTPIPQPTPTPTPLPAELMDITQISLPEPIGAGRNELLQQVKTYLQNNGPLNMQIHTNASIGACTASPQPEARAICVEYGYIATYATFEFFTGRPPTLWDVLSIVYFRELKDFSFANSTNTPIAVEALTRKFFDSQSGGCRFIAQPVEGYDCTYANMVNWLAGIEGWYNRAFTSNQSSTKPLVESPPTAIE